VVIRDWHGPRLATGFFKPSFFSMGLAFFFFYGEQIAKRKAYDKAQSGNGEAGWKRS